MIPGLPQPALRYVAELAARLRSATMARDASVLDFGGHVFDGHNRVSRDAPTKLFIPPFYSAAFFAAAMKQKTREQGRAGTPPGVAFMGTRGVGMSMMRNYHAACFAKLATPVHPVVLVMAKWVDQAYTGPTYRMVFTGVEPPAVSMVDCVFSVVDYSPPNSSTWVLVDVGDCRVLPYTVYTAHVWAYSSPAMSFIKDMHKETGWLSLWMPVWPRQELQLAGRCLHPDDAEPAVRAAMIDEAFNQLGGLPGHCFATSEAVAAACAACKAAAVEVKSRHDIMRIGVVSLALAASPVNQVAQAVGVWRTHWPARLWRHTGDRTVPDPRDASQMACAEGPLGHIRAWFALDKIAFRSKYVEHVVASSVATHDVGGAASSPNLLRLTCSVDVGHLWKCLAVQSYCLLSPDGVPVQAMPMTPGDEAEAVTLATNAQQVYTMPLPSHGWEEVVEDAAERLRKGGCRVLLAPTDRDFPVCGGILLFNGRAFKAHVDLLHPVEERVHTFTTMIHTTDLFNRIIAKLKWLGFAMDNMRLVFAVARCNIRVDVGAMSAKLAEVKRYRWVTSYRSSPR